jgi:hypothetical protein
MDIIILKPHELHIHKDLQTLTSKEQNTSFSFFYCRVQDRIIVSLSPQLSGTVLYYSITSDTEGNTLDARPLSFSV